jgi:hypothetical protein
MMLQQVSYIYLLYRSVNNNTLLEECYNEMLCLLNKGFIFFTQVCEETNVFFEYEFVYSMGLMGLN